MNFRKILKKIFPDLIINFLKKLKIVLSSIRYKKMNTYEVFKDIYQKKIWTPNNLKNEFQFFSGIGSYENDFIKPYLQKVQIFLDTLPKKKDVLDLGCGDFTIGSKLRNFFRDYKAIDINDELIEYNKKRYSHLNISFKALDITKETLPAADICILRQVLQHLSNDAIQKFLLLNKNKFKYIILTEHLPDSKNFISNIDMPTSPFVRVEKNSGVILTDPPFNLEVVKTIQSFDLKPKKISNFVGRINTKILQLY